MDTAIIVKVAVATVGVVQLIKNLINKGNKLIWTLVTIGVGFGMTALQYLAPTWVMDGAIIVSGASLFYDTIYQTFEKIFKKEQ
jgi:hypothetical protein